MKKIIAKVNFDTGYIKYIKGDEIKGLTYEQIIKLNEKGFIEPLDYNDLVLIERELKYNKKEEL